ncbi:MAG: exonuclease SbcCD subunit D C-terminal domain-containing protein [Magnetococcales bacterium]|nr:exonuclease SbcCD subunit D C-terminal domain-containing protein [Magnetococcales bacterium]
MKICHTSDWHLGHRLCGQRREEEFAAFLAWLVETLQREAVEVLLIAGDLFDTAAPNNRAQELYYRFLAQIAGSTCRHVVVIGGNHDSPSFLDAPRKLLAALQVHVIGAIGEDPAEEVLVLPGLNGAPELLVCAVPYLRDRDIRFSEAAESVETKDRKLVEGIRDHYAVVVDLAMQRRQALGGEIPIIVMGHLFASGGRVHEGEGVRDLYVGSLAQIPVTLFPEGVDYLALGHLHLAQQLGGSETRRYSGSPLALGFGEVGREKSLCLVTFQGRHATVSLLPVPVFQPLESIRGNRERILARMSTLVAENKPIWVEVLHADDAPIGDLRLRLNEMVAGSPVMMLRIRDERLLMAGLSGLDPDEEIEALDEQMVFERCLELRGISECQRDDLRRAYQEIIESLNHEET